ncbi:hypothetical protein EVAR_86056_1 [Eumeta japonica]|uniref:Uncharacterized protein n=1 Tax=Eumeta variegata TaxID=151549 RepID=A0A4C1UJA8_EUMVA|nr:hypothetical protein EVAR_86056_1 [Eumeta japonica]
MNVLAYFIGELKISALDAPFARTRSVYFTRDSRYGRGGRASSSRTCGLASGAESAEVRNVMFAKRVLNLPDNSLLQMNNFAKETIIIEVADSDKKPQKVNIQSTTLVLSNTVCALKFAHPVIRSSHATGAGTRLVSPPRVRRGSSRPRATNDRTQALKV